MSPTTEATMYQAFGETPCRSLMVPGLKGNAFLSARNFVDTNRLREWKPQNPALRDNDPRYSYCYIDNDDQNGIKDYVMERLTCDTNSAPFSSPMFESIFEDRSVDRTRTVPVNKCVMKIKNDSINLPNASDFWDKMGVINCQQIAGPINDDNYRLTRERDTCMEAKKSLQTDLNNYTTQAQERVLLLAASQSNLTGTQTALTQTRSALSSANDNISGLNDRLNYLQGEYNKNIQSLTFKERQCLTEKQGLQTSLTNTRIELEQANDKFESVSTRYLDIGKNYSTLQAAHTTLNDTYKNLRERSTAALESLDICYEEKNALLIKSRQADAQMAIFANMNKQLVDCTAELARIKRTSVDSDQRLAYFRGLADETQASLRACESNKAVLETKLVEMTQQIMQLRKEVAELEACKTNLAQTKESLGVTNRRLDSERNNTSSLQNFNQAIQAELANRITKLVSGQLNFICANSELASKNVAMQDVVDGLTRNIQELLMRYNTNESKCATTASTLVDTTRNKNSLDNQLGASQSTVSSLNQRNASLQSSFDTIVQDNRALTSYINTYCRR